MRGRKVESIMELRCLSTLRKSVVGDAGWCKKPLPAAFVMNMTCNVVLRGIEYGLFEYQKKEENNG